MRLSQCFESQPPEGTLGVALQEIALVEGCEIHEVVADVVSHAEARELGPKVRVEFELTDVAAIAEYLSATGWQIETENRHRSIWRHSTGMSVFIPQALTPDTEDLFQLVIHKIALVEGREELEVVAGLMSHAGAQRGEIKVQTAPDDQLTTSVHPGAKSEEPTARPTSAPGREVAPPEPSGSPASRGPTDRDFPESQDPTRRLDDLKRESQDGTANIDRPEL